MKKYLIALFLLFSSACHAENIDKNLIIVKLEKIHKKIHEKFEKYQYNDDEMLRLIGYCEALEFVLSIID